MVNSESMKIEDLKTKIADAINNSDLSPSVIKLVIDGIAKEVTTLASQELVADIKKWKAEQEEEEAGQKITEDPQPKAKAKTVPVYDEMDLVEDPQPKAKAKAKTVPVYDEMDLAEKPQYKAKAKTVPVDNKIDLQDK